MVNERMAQEVLGLAFRAVRFGEAELEKVIRDYLAEQGGLYLLLNERLR